MKEQPIPFSGPMVRAILAGRKTQTRRLVRTCRQFRDMGATGPDDAYDVVVGEHHGDALFLVAGDHGYTDPVPCPYGAVGDRLWVREAWRSAVGLDKVKGAASLKPHCQPLDVPIRYEADGEDRDGHRIDNFGGRWGRYRHARFMPRWACRLLLEVTEVRVQRLQDTSASDARAEGIVERDRPDEFSRDAVVAIDGSAYLNVGHAFASLWDSINGKRAPWASNPWVWAVTFQRVSP